MEETSTNIGWKSKREREEREEGGREIANGMRGKVGERERERGRETATVISRNFDGNREIALTREEEGSETSRASKDPVILD